MKDVVWTLDTETMHFLYVSPSVQRLRGFSVEEILAAPEDAAMTPEAAATMKSLILERTAALLSGKTPSDHFYTNQVEQPCKDGGSVWTEVITRYRIDEKSGHVVVLGVTRDISERLHGEELERYSAFQAGIAENSVSVLHNVGNAITSVLMDAKALRGAASDLTQLAEMLAADLEAVRARLGSAEPGRAEVERLLAIEQEAMMVIRRLAADGLMARSQRIGDSVERIAEMVSLRQDAVTPGAAGEACDLGQLLRDALAMRQDGLTRLGIEVELNLDAGLVRVTLSRNRLLQALLHVIGNAQDAIEARQAIEAGAGRILIRGEALDAAFFRLTLSDNGIGIDSDPATRTKLFASGYTTKPRGTGYGLHAAALFAREVGGSVSLDSPGRMRGATLTLVLPFVPASGIADAAAASLSGSMQ